ncbi:MAG TPA: argininosuccinate lyase [Halanaerobiales bacterium]|nr:argininosuccinate lyase [Halanaerobiales bacterium]
MKLWGGRFEEETAELMKKFNNSLNFDIRLYKYDVQGSIAHVKMLSKQNIIKEEEKEKIVNGLKKVKDDLKEEIKKDKINLNESEDIHSLVEKRLTEKIGELAGKMHTARSRNDQVALDMRLFLRKEVNNIEKLLQNLMSTILEIADENLEVIMPGYTHLQRAQPITFSHHFLAYYFKLKRDYERLEDNLKRINIMPLGSGALAGSSFPLDREWVSSELGFNRPAFNSIDGVSDRDYIVEFLAIVSNIMIHLSSFSEEIILWNSKEFNFISLADKYTTGSSIMPQKKNPDLAELVRGKTGMTFGNLFQLMTTLKGLPLAYNKDLQEDKEGLFKTIDSLKVILKLYPKMIKTMEINESEMEKAVGKGFLNATELANYFTKKGVPFRKAHEMVGKAVLYAQKESKELNDISLLEWKEIFPEKFELFDEELIGILDVKESLKNYDSLGGPAPKEVKRRIDYERKFWL